VERAEAADEVELEEIRGEVRHVARDEADVRRRSPLPQPQLGQKAAVARKILIAAWHMLSRNEPFRPAPRSTAGTSAPASSRVVLAA
jgi:hypothetical protein